MFTLVFSISCDYESGGFAGKISSWSNCAYLVLEISCFMKHLALYGMFIVYGVVKEHPYSLGLLYPVCQNQSYQEAWVEARM